MYERDALQQPQWHVNFLIYVIILLSKLFFHAFRATTSLSYYIVYCILLLKLLIIYYNIHVYTRARAYQWIIIVVVRPTEYIIYVYNNNFYCNNTIAAVLISSKIALEIQYGHPDCPLAHRVLLQLVVGRLSKIRMSMLHTHSRTPI